MITSDLLSILCCPICKKGELHPEIQVKKNDQIKDGKLTCATCRVSYPVKAGIPYLAPQAVLDTAEWQLWKDHLDGLQTRREARLEHPDRLIHRIGQSQKEQTSFAEFIGETEGNVLDIGCGPGQF